MKKSTKIVFILLTFGLQLSGCTHDGKKLSNDKSESQKPIIEHELDDDAGNYDFDIEVSLLGGLDSPTGGKILFDGTDIRQTGLDRHRKMHVSFIFQSYNLIDYMTPLENVRLTAKKPPREFLEHLGLTQEEINRNVLKLSGGQQQRVAIAR